LLEALVLDRQSFATVNAHLSAVGKTIWQSPTILATVISEPSSTNITEGNRDPEMHQSNN
jgi:IS5 family transposase